MRQGEDAVQVQPQAVFHDQADDAERGAAQRVGVLGAGRLFVDREEADQGIQLVGQRHGDADRRGRAAVVGAERLVMLRDARRRPGRPAFAQGVVAAHDALKLGELSDHAGDQIGLGEPGGQPRLIGIGAGDEGGQFSRQRLHPGNFLGDRAELCVEGDRIERRNALFQLHLAVLVPEELGVRQAGAQHALVAGDHGGAAVRGGRVGDHDEAGGELAGGVGRGEVFLVRPHGGGQHLRRHVHELLIDGAAQHDRPFDKAGDLVQQAFVGGDDKAVAAGDFRRVGGDHGAALVAGQDDMGFPQRRRGTRRSCWR